MSNNGTCRMCGRVDKLVKAHIIPDALYDPLFAESVYARMETNEAGKFGSRASTGVYDREIVCLPCERRFSPWDRYAVQFFRDRDWSTLAPVPGMPISFLETSDFNYALLKLFVMSLLWRAAVSTQNLFSKVVLVSSQETELRGLLLRSDPGTPDQFSVLFDKFDGPLPSHPEVDPRSLLLDPHPEEFGAHSWMRFYAIGWIIHVRTDEGRLHPPATALGMMPNHPLRVRVRNFAGSPELQLMQNMIREIDGRRGKK